MCDHSKLLILSRKWRLKEQYLSYKLVLEMKKNAKHFGLSCHSTLLLLLLLLSALGLGGLLSSLPRFSGIFHSSHLSGYDLSSLGDPGLVSVTLLLSAPVGVAGRLLQLTQPPLNQDP